MLDRARAFTSSDLHDEKMVSLGKLSAGLAHELNNPASAIERSATLLDDRLEEAERAARALGASRLTEAQLAAVDAVRASCLATQVPACRSPIEQAEREEAIADWLADHGLDSATRRNARGHGGDVRSARPARQGRRWTGVERRAEVGRVRVFGPQPRIGDSGRRHCASRAWSARSKASLTWIRPRLPNRWTSSRV